MISDAVKYFLKQYSYLVDKKDYETFLNQLWEEGLSSEEVIDLFTILNSINPTPIPKYIRIDHVLKTIKHLIDIASNLTPAEWRENYNLEDAIDKDGDLLLGNLLQGFKMHTFGFTNGHLYGIAENYKDELWPDGEIYWQ